MKTIWITYSWEDNKNSDVDYVANELERAGVKIKLDRWNISAGRRLWSQIDHFITSPDESDGWLLIATNNSLSSEACKEEYAYALDRALSIRGKDYPVIALFLDTCDENLIPTGIKTRRYVSITDLDWKDTIIASVEGRLPQVQRQQLKPYYISIHENQSGDRPIAIEVRPRAGVWAPFIAAIPLNQKEKVSPRIMIGPKDVPTNSGMLVTRREEVSEDEKMWMISAGNQATPTQSYYIWCKCKPSILVFGVYGGSPQFQINYEEFN